MKQKLTKRQLNKLNKWLRDDNPQQLKFPFMVWTPSDVTHLVKDQFGIELTEYELKECLKVIGFFFETMNFQIRD